MGTISMNHTSIIGIVSGMVIFRFRRNRGKTTEPTTRRTNKEFHVLPFDLKNSMLDIFSNILVRHMIIGLTLRQPTTLWMHPSSVSTTSVSILWQLIFDLFFVKKIKNKVFNWKENWFSMELTSNDLWRERLLIIPRKNITRIIF